MKINQVCYQNGKWDKKIPSDLNSKNTLCFAFFGPDAVIEKGVTDLKKSFPDSMIVGCSGAGEILGTNLSDQSMIVTVAKFENSKIKTFRTEISSADKSFAAGESLAKNFDKKDLKAVYILSEGLLVNGTDLVKGLRNVLPADVVVSGGLAGDGTRFKTTKILFDDQVQSKVTVAIGFYGDEITVVSGSKGGWIPFGPERKVTNSEGNTLFTIDDKPALTLYKEFLGNSAANLPASALNFPLEIQETINGKSFGIVRTILSVDELNKTMTFAGDIPKGKIVRLMRSTQKSLVEAATNCAQGLQNEISDKTPVLSLIVSCVGRRLVMGSGTEDEIESVFSMLPKGSIQTGFYSYGELAPDQSGFCDLHNQTMTITWIQENKSA